MSPSPTNNNDTSVIREIDPTLQEQENKLVSTIDAVNQPHPDINSILVLWKKNIELLLFGTISIL